MRTLRPDLTLSYAALARACGHVASDGAVWRKDDGNQWSRGGQRVHHAFACLTTGVACESLAEEPTLAAMLASASDWLGPRRRYPSAEVEVVYAYDTHARTARKLLDLPGFPVRWYADPAWRAKYDGPGGPVRPSELCGRLDFVCAGVDARGGFVELRDLKCHFGPTFVDSRAQLEWQALAVATAWADKKTGERPRVKAAGLHVWGDGREAFHEWIGKRPSEDEDPELGAFALDQIEAGIEDLLVVPANDAQPREGRHCGERYCPAAVDCPTTKRAMGELHELADVIAPARLMRKGEKKPSLTEPIRSNEDAVYSRIATGLLEVALEARREEEKRWADAHDGIVYDDGLVWSGEPVPKASADLRVPGVKALLIKLGLGEAIKESTSWEAMDKVKGGGAAKKARAELEKIDGLRCWTETVYTLRRPKAGARALKAQKARTA